MFKKTPVTFKGKKVYGIASPTRTEIICLWDDKERAQNALDSDWNIFVEATVTRVFTRERELKEIETEL